VIPKNVQPLLETVMEDKNLHQDRWQRSLFLHTNRKEWFDRI
jgi:hypothetical protein